jgi:hypothetical protein
MERSRQRHLGQRLVSERDEQVEICDVEPVREERTRQLATAEAGQ